MRHSAVTAVRIERSARHGVSHAERAESDVEEGADSLAVADGSAGAAGVAGGAPVAVDDPALGASPPSSWFAAAMRAWASSIVVGGGRSVDDGDAADGGDAPPHAARTIDDIAKKKVLPVRIRPG